MDNQEKAIAKRMQQWEKEFREGNRARCLDAIWLCLQFNRSVPQWAIERFISSMWRYTSAEARTLDDAFGIRRPKGWRQDRARQRYGRGIKAHIQARALVERKGYTVADSKNGNSAIAEVAEQLSMSEADVERWYYDKLLMKELGYSQKLRRKSKKTEGD